ncbi:MAG TPA: helix-turn-helix transcriptional regulator [Gammaproteobacteria bacterium]|nr:helix-turn-helix transcriptional regulator [Gammaproteobacteria bacterium]
MKIGHAIKKCRQLKNISLSLLADETGLSKSYLSLVENEKRQISLESLEKVSSLLDVPLYLLIYLAAEPEEMKEIKGELKTEFDNLLINLIKKNE